MGKNCRLTGKGSRHARSDIDIPYKSYKEGPRQAAPRGEKPYAKPIFRTDAGASHRAVSDFRAVALFVRPVVLRSLRSGREAGREAGQEEGGQEEGEGEEESGGENQERLQTLEGRRRSLDHHR